MAETKQIKLQGRVFITFDIEAKTGLHIGGSDTGIEIGGVDKTVIRDPLTNRPYIPGSSLRGKMRSLTEKHLGRKVVRKNMARRSSPISSKSIAGNKSYQFQVYFTWRTLNTNISR